MSASASAAAPARKHTAARPAAAALSGKTLCSIVKNPVTSKAAKLLGKFLPEGLNPGEDLLLVIKGVVEFCPQVVSIATKVHALWVKHSHPSPAAAEIFEPLTSFDVSRTMQVATGAATAFVSWVGFGVGGYEEQTAAAGTFDQAVSVGPLLPFVTRPVVPGTRYQFFVRGFNGGQPATGWARSPVFVPTVSDVQVSGNGWQMFREGNAYNGTIAATSGTGAVTFHVNPGFAMAIVAPVFPQGGTADIYVDGAYKRSISLYWPTPRAGRLVFVWSWPSNGSHTVVLQPRGGVINLDAELTMYQP